VNTQALYEYVSETQIPLGLPMLATLSGFTDAGASGTQVADNVFSNLDTELLIQFNNDALLDFRSRRPVMYFDRDHISAYEPAILAIYLVHDEAGQPFLYLNGYEPDFRWDAFTAALVNIIETLAVSQFVWVHSIPFPLPHTRPLGITVSGSRADLIDRYSEWKPETQVPGNVLHLIEYRLGEAEVPSTGFVMLVPHYIADSEYPQVAITGFELISAATSLVFPTDEIRAVNDKFLGKLNSQLVENAELARLVEQLEQGYQSGKMGPVKARVSPNDPMIPSADDLASDIEDYLAARRRNISDGEPN
jgi:hypothetical protein